MEWWVGWGGGEVDGGRFSVGKGQKELAQKGKFRGSLAINLVSGGALACRQRGAGFLVRPTKGQERKWEQRGGI